MRLKKYIFFLLLIGVFTNCKPSLNTTLTAKEPVEFAEKPKNIILMIGDGMGLGQISASIFNSNKKQPYELFSVIGFQKTSAYNTLITDSAAAATAMACGEKTYRNAIGLTKDTIRCQSILEEAELKGLATGLVVTSSITHATPASFYAHQKLRNFTENIAAEFVDSGVDFAVGGGKQYFVNRYSDERNLLKELGQKGYNLFNYDARKLKKLKGAVKEPTIIFTAANRPFSVLEGRNYLPKAAVKATEFLNDFSDLGFFLMIEGSQIDWAAHANEGNNVLLEMQDFNNAIYEVLDFVNRDKETLLIITADHETGGLTINKKSKMGKLNLKFTSKDHTATMVPVFAYGAGAELFRGIYDNTEIYHKMKQALGWELGTGK